MRTFKPAWFAKAARKAGIADRELCAAIRDVAKGQADDLGGGVFKKRLNRNRHRSIILTKVGSYWLSQYIFAKKDRANIDDDELRAFRQLAKALEKTSEVDIARLVSTGHITEICDGGEADI
ncbi:type II toxin-antitoxin system RelE/ParE family toxin [Methylobacterium sp. 1973]|uniref:type II toxin-antitoxin system RelE/ParE family toxin n=1 Tax=Methylobacterium sp. 1973 TaxID=3156421 RepID=UPI003398B6F4